MREAFLEMPVLGQLLYIALQFDLICLVTLLTGFYKRSAVFLDNVQTINLKCLQLMRQLPQIMRTMVIKFTPLTYQSRVGMSSVTLAALTACV